VIYFWLNNNEWFVEQVSLAAIAKELGTPCYVYSKAALLICSLPSSNKLCS